MKEGLKVPNLFCYPFKINVGKKLKFFVFFCSVVVDINRRLLLQILSLGNRDEEAMETTGEYFGCVCVQTVEVFAW